MAKKKDKDSARAAVNMEENTASMDQPAKVDFDAWFALRKNKIPAHHHKEIIKADFKGRGLGQLETMANFDAALKKYGLKLD
jgi:hypothetical protein